MKEITKHMQIELLKTIGIKRLPRIKVANQMNISEFTLRRVLDKNTPVKVSNQTFLIVNNWLQHNNITSIYKTCK